MTLLSSILIKTILPTLEIVGEAKLVESLQQLHDKDLEKYKIVIGAGNTFVKELKQIDIKDNTDIIASLLSALEEGITTSASANAIVLE